MLLLFIPRTATTVGARVAYSPPILWGSGCTWGADASTWGAALLTAGIPNLYVAVEGELVTGCRVARWRMGRDDWFATLQPSSGSFSAVGTLTASPNDLVVVSTDAGLLWSGYIDDVTTTIDLAGTWTTFTATDIIGRLGMTIKPLGNLSVGGDTHRWMEYAGGALSPDLEDATEYLLGLYAPGITVTVGDSAGTLPTLDDEWYDPPDLTLLEVLNTLERSSNAMMATQPDGSIVIVMRDALVAASVEMTPLTGDDGPAEWTESTSRANVINHWLLERPAYHQETVLDETSATSANAYGDRSYSVSDYQCSGYSHFSSALRTAMATPRAIVTGATIHVRELGQGALFLAPLSWVTHDGDTWQVMSVEHDVQPGAGMWSVNITADASQNAITGNTEPAAA